MPAIQNRTTNLAALVRAAKGGARRDLAAMRETALRLNHDWRGHNELVDHHVGMLLNELDAIDNLVANLEAETPAGHGDAV